MHVLSCVVYCGAARVNGRGEQSQNIICSAIHHCLTLRCKAIRARILGVGGASPETNQRAMRRMVTHDVGHDVGQNAKMQLRSYG